MNQHKYMRAGILAVTLLLGSWLYWGSPTSPSQQASPGVVTNVAKAVFSMPTNAIKNIDTNTAPPSALENIYSNAASLREAYDKGLISKGEAMQATLMEQNKKSLDLYGLVVDQNGQPVVGVKVRGSIGLNVNMVQSGGEIHYTETDSLGRFNFLGIHGVGIGLWPQKEGYFYDLKLPSQRPDNYHPDPNNPIVFTMWKLNGPEPMIHTKLHSYVPCDGTQTTFNLLTGKKDANGDLLVKISRDPVNIDRSKPFNWSLTVKLPNGGLQDITDIYPNEAPAEGYQAEITFDFPTNKPNWTYSFARAFYFKCKNGQVYGRMSVNVMANFQPPPTLFDAEIYANPAGSRNLEFEPAKQIR